jgi:hypothetical protein
MVGRSERTSSEEQPTLSSKVRWHPPSSLSSEQPAHSLSPSLLIWIDVHEWTTTVREAFRMSAYLRQPASVSKEAKDEYCEEIIQLLELEDLADAMIGFPGFGLSVEARKRCRSALATFWFWFCI